MQSIIKISLYRLAGFYMICFSVIILSAVLFPRNCEAFTLLVNNPQVDSSLIFHRATITFSGTVDEGSTVIVKISGTNKKVVLGKNGLIPSGYYMVDNLPGQYKILSSGSLAGISPEIKKSLDLTNDFNFLKKGAVVYTLSGDEKLQLTGPESEKQINQAVSINERNGCYGIFENSINVEGGKFRGSLRIGRNEYSPQLHLQFYVIKNNTVSDQKSEFVNIPLNLFGRPLGLENEPFLFAGIFLCLTVLLVTGLDEMLGRGGNTACR
jgi:hypothetical protein